MRFFWQRKPSPRTRMTSEQYEQAFGLANSSPKTDPPKALSLALEIRKFEIELYWKRATYFWTFIAIALGGYVTVLAGKLPDSEKSEALITCSCVGVVFSVAWYFVNRASKFWQENWEKHVDLLEDTVIGPLYKTVLSDDNISFWRKPFGPYYFSVSKINQILSLFVVALFLLLAGTTGWKYFRFGWPPDPFSTIVAGLTILAVWILFLYGRTTEGERRRREAERGTHAHQRTTKIV
jgi:hypothetical protein